MGEAGTVLYRPGCIPTQYVQCTYNPYHLKLQQSSMSSGLHLSLDSQDTGYLMVCWGAQIKHMYPTVYLPWPKLYTAFWDREKAKEFLEPMCEKLSVQSISPCQGEHIHIAVPPGLDLGPVPRDKYPVVLFLVSDAVTLGEPATENNNVVFHAAIIHLQDDVCPLESHVISHFVRCSGGAPYDLQKLFNSGITREQYSSTNHDTSPDQPSQNTSAPQQDTDQSQTRNALNTDSSVTDVCIICQVNDVNKAFLPCRHACICDRCFGKVDKCPMCRGYIYSYFNLSDEVQQGVEDVEENVEENEHWFYRWNNRLNQYIGFT